jgi:hypothetical protein
MSVFCELVPSQKGYPKLNAHGFLMVKDKNRDKYYYWICEKKKALGCKGRASTLLVQGRHQLRKTSDHNHLPDATRSTVSQSLAKIKGNLSYIIIYLLYQLYIYRNSKKY